MTLLLSIDTADFVSGSAAAPIHTAAEGVLCCRPLMNAEVLHGMSRCGMNMPSPDLLTPKESVATIWSWAEGHPFPVASTAATAMNQAASGAMGSWWQSWVQAGVQLGRRWLGSGLSQVRPDAIHSPATLPESCILRSSEGQGAR